jgi:hypothetical protein
MLYFVTRGRAFKFYIKGSKGLTATTITTTTTTFNTKHKINCKLTHDYVSSMLSQFYKLSLSMLYVTSQLETLALLAYVYLVFERPLKETFPAISLNKNVNYLWLFSVTMEIHHQKISLNRGGSEDILGDNTKFMKL